MVISWWPFQMTLSWQAPPSAKTMRMSKIQNKNIQKPNHVDWSFCILVMASLDLQTPKVPIPTRNSMWRTTARELQDQLIGHHLWWCHGWTGRIPLTNPGCPLETTDSSGRRCPISGVWATVVVGMARLCTKRLYGLIMYAFTLVTLWILLVTLIILNPH